LFFGLWNSLFFWSQFGQIASSTCRAGQCTFTNPPWKSEAVLQMFQLTCISADQYTVRALFIWPGHTSSCSHSLCTIGNSARSLWRWHVIPHRPINKCDYDLLFWTRPVIPFDLDSHDPCIYVMYIA